MDSPLLTYGFLSAIRSILRLCLCFFGEIGCLHPTEVHPTGGSRRVSRQVSWLEVGSAKMMLSGPAHQRVTPAVGWFIDNNEKKIDIFLVIDTLYLAFCL